MRLQQTDQGVAGSAGIFFDLDRGNSDVTQIKISGDIVYRSGRSTLLWFNDGSWLFQEDDDLVNKGFTHLRHNYRFRPWLTGEVFGQAQYDRSQDLKRRYLGGAGVRVVPFRRGAGFVAIGLTPMYEYEKLTSGGESRTFRVSSYVSASIRRKDRFSLSSTTYVQPAADRIADIRILNESQLAVAISSFLSLTTTLSYRYDSEPPAAVKEYDLSLSQGLQVSF
ncbi:DUF481 domain-containing protein [bacterium]|nr:DUF481 domain-containing protein [bacterium]